MRGQRSNMLYGVLDYAAYPAAMLLAAPIIVHNLGAAAYGLWSVMTAVVSAGSILSAGFGDANIQHVSEQRGLGDQGRIIATVRMLLGCNLCLALMVGAVLLLFSSTAAAHIAPGTGALHTDCLLCLYLAAALIALRAVESVCISTQRAYERYGAAVRVSIAGRLVALLLGTLLTGWIHRVAIVLAVTVVVSCLGTAWQFVPLRRLLGVRNIRPVFDFASSKAFLHFGMYSWLIAAAGLAFGQFDRLILGLVSGAAPVASYALCAQLTQPVYGLAAAGLHILFPYIASRANSESPAFLQRTITVAAAYNVAFVLVASALLWIAAPRLLAYLGRDVFDGDQKQLLAPVLFSSALLALSVTPTYALSAVRRIRFVALINLAGAGISIGCMLLLGRTWGAMGIAYARLGYGVIALCLYLPLRGIFHRSPSNGFATRTCEGL